MAAESTCPDSLSVTAFLADHVCGSRGGSRLVPVWGGRGLMFISATFQRRFPTTGHSFALSPLSDREECLRRHSSVAKCVLFSTGEYRVPQCLTVDLAQKI